MREPANDDESLRDPEANSHFYYVVALAVGVLIAGTGLVQLGKWRMEDCAALAGTNAACAHGPGTGLLIGGAAMVAIGALGLMLHRRRRR